MASGSGALTPDSIPAAPETEKFLMQPFPQSVTNPDPSQRTLDMIRDAIMSIRKESDARDKSVDNHFLSIEKSIQVAHDDLVRVPTEVTKAVIGLRELLDQTIKTSNAQNQTILEKYHSEFEGSVATHEEKFESIKATFASQAVATDKLGLADKTALAAALQAQKENAFATSENLLAALVKMGEQFTKQIDQLMNLVNAIKQSSDEKINDIKGRLDRGEGKQSVSDPALVQALAGINSTMASLTTSRDQSTGASTTKAAMIGFVVSSVIAGSALLGLVFTIATHNGATTAPLQQLSDRNDLGIARLAQQNTELIQRLEQRLNALPPK